MNETIIDLLRHAKAGKHDTDKLRFLTDEGQRQALERRESFVEIIEGRRVYRHYDLILASPAMRAVQTATIVSGQIQDAETPIEVPELHWESDPDFHAKMDEMFSRLGYAKPSVYLAENNGVFIWAHGEKAWRTVSREVIRSGAKRVLVVGHAMLICVMGQVAVQMGVGDGHITERQRQLDIDVAEAAGFQLYLTNDKVSHVEVF